MSPWRVKNLYVAGLTGEYTVTCVSEYCFVYMHTRSNFSVRITPHTYGFFYK